MNFKLPTIDKNKQGGQQQEYNFVNTKQRRKTKDMVTPPLGIIDDLKKKIQQQKREIETRNNAIMALQRNFQSMAALLKTQKAQNIQMKDEFQRTKKLMEQNGKKVIQYHQKSIHLTNELKKQQIENAKLQEQIHNVSHLPDEIKVHIKSIESLTKSNKKLQLQIRDLEGQKQQLIGQLRQLKNVQQQRRLSTELISGLKSDMKVLISEKQALEQKISKIQQINRVLTVNIKNGENHIQTLRKKNLDEKSKQLQANTQITRLKNKIILLQQQITKIRIETQNKDVIIMMKMKSEQELKGAMVELKMKMGKGQGDLYQKQIQTQQLRQCIDNSEKKIISVLQQLEQQKLKNKHLQQQVKKGKQCKQQTLLLLNQIEDLKENIKQLQLSQVRKDNKIFQLETLIEKYSIYFSQIDVNQPVKIICQIQYNKLLQDLNQYSTNANDNQSISDDLNNRLLLQQRQIINLCKKIEQYQNCENQLTKLLSHQKSVLEKLQMQKLLKQQQIDKEKQKNKQLWYDNKKLKDKEQKLIEEKQAQKRDIIIKSQKELQRLERQKQSQLKEKQMRLKSEYQKQMELLKNTNNDEIARLLKKRGDITKEMEQKLIKTSQEVQFYKNRYKQLEGVSSRTQKKLKQIQKTYEQNINTLQNSYDKLQKQHSDLKIEHKSCSQNIQGLANRLSSLEQSKKQSIILTQQNKSLKDKLKSFEIEIMTMRKKLQVFQSEDFIKKRDSVNNKIQLLLKSVSDLYQSLISIKNHISCSHCCQLPVQTIKVIPCGHIYCKSCKQGYEQVCQQCKRGGNPIPDKQHDQLVVKLNYMQMILMSVKQDTTILSKM